MYFKMYFLYFLVYIVAYSANLPRMGQVSKQIGEKVSLCRSLMNDDCYLW